MAEYNGVTLEPLMDGSQDRDYQVEQFIFWGAGRAAVLALSPKFSNVCTMHKCDIHGNSHCSFI